MDNIINWKMKCIDISIYDEIYTVNKIYAVINLQFTCDDGSIFNLKSCNINNFEQFNNWSGAKWELVEDKYAEIEKYKNKI